MGRVAIITGASRGIGAATAELAARDGYDVCVNYASDAAAAEAICARCETEGVRALPVQADIADPNAVAALFEICDAKLGRPDLLVNNAGIIGAASLLADLDPAVLHRTFAVNFYGTVYCAQQAVRRMSTARGGSGGVIVNISSIAAVIGSAGEYIHYAASKGAVETFTIGLAKEVGPEGIRVACVRAGTADTEIHERSGNPDRPAMVAQVSALRRVASAEEIAEAVIWLGSDRAAYVTGAILPVSGGM